MKHFKKVAIFLVLVGTIAISMVACNMEVIDKTYNFDRVIVSLPNGEVVEGKVDSWTDYQDGDMVQVKIDGKTYFTHSSNVVLIAE